MNETAPPLPPAGTPLPAPYPPDSRYAGTPITTRTLSDGRTVSYLRRRFVPPPNGRGTWQEHEVTPTDRLDSLAATAYGDPELWWRIADANRAHDPDDLLERGVVLRIGTPDGTGGVPL